MKNICFVLILLLSLQSYFGHAQEHPLARLWKVNDSEIPRLLELERNLTELDKILSQILEQDDYITNFAGSYINLMNESIVVMTLNLSKFNDLISLPEINPHRNFFHPGNATISTAQLRKNFEQITQIALNIRPINIFFYINIEINNIILFFEYKNNTINEKFINETEPFHPHIIYAEEPPYSLAQQTIKSPRDVRKISVIIPGGEGIFNHGPESYGCSVGFWARDAINTKNTYIITTGHGIDSRLGLNEFYPWPWENNAPPPESRKIIIGTPVVFSVNTFDYALIKVKRKNVIPSFEVRNSDFAQYPILFINDGLHASGHGIHLCKSGHTTHFTCGYIKGFNGIFGDEEGFTRNLIITDMLAKDGDSGGSVISFDAPNNLRSVSLAGIHAAQSINIAAGQSLETIISAVNSSWNIKIVPVLRPRG
ncbi:hypothetical protein C2G38_2242041 [Gigaspora rosea]|uniref:Peptidase S1 domain-containing protein n=1 Tax=Gigaspora rosea TaxID=44941 RepID=A0A397VPD9_9GLOM|nr:hypothetical protein C2G38_2242041 [Gigaspora rosea]